MFKRGGIYAVNLAHSETSSQESCPCLVVSNNISNEYSSVVTIIPLSMVNLDRIYDFECFLPAAKSGLGVDAKISSHIIITIDKSSVVGERLGFLNKGLMEQVEKTLRLQLALE
ncbi:MAG: type II toxin-antitoxin system PemK/MazF family toxin [Desulfuromonadales bacterium]|nr:type II toxin-antitoxin system PemK/MazF family toxin [Desulfuromonadales bacterium]